MTSAESLSLSPKTCARAPLACGAIQLGRGDRIVFVDDGDYAEGQELGQRGAQILVARGVEEVVFGEQDLRDAVAQLIEGVVIEAHQAALADGGAGLHHHQLGGLGRKAKPLRAQAHGAGGNQEHFAAGAAQVGQRFGDAVQHADRGRAVVAHHDVGADLHDNARGRSDAFARRQSGRWTAR